MALCGIWHCVVYGIVLYMALCGMALWYSISCIVMFYILSLRTRKAYNNLFYLQCVTSTERASATETITYSKVILHPHACFEYTLSGVWEMSL